VWRKPLVLLYLRSPHTPRAPHGDIVEWIDEPRDATGESRERVTALCPRRGIAAVLPSASYYPLTDTLLAEMHHHFFER
jgi:hypothetical protein